MTLTVTGLGGSDDEVKTNYVTVNAAPSAPVAAFTNATPRSGTVPLSVTFTDQSTGTLPLTYAWNFGDGNTSTSENPSHTYTAVGSYSVNLTVTNSVGSNRLIKNELHYRNAHWQHR